MYLVICNNTKQNFSGETEKINVKFHKMTTYTWNFQKHQEYFLTKPYVCHENIHSHHSGQGRNKTITLYKSWTYHQHFPSALWYTIQIKTWRLHKWQERKNQKIRGISLMLNEINFFLSQSLWNTAKLSHIHSANGHFNFFTNKKDYMR